MQHVWIQTAHILAVPMHAHLTPHPDWPEGLLVVPRTCLRSIARQHPPDAPSYCSHAADRRAAVAASVAGAGAARSAHAAAVYVVNVGVVAVVEITGFIAIVVLVVIIRNGDADAGQETLQ